MNKEADLISILLNETYGQLSEVPCTESTSLSEYFKKKDSGKEALLSYEVRVFPQFVRVSFNSSPLDIPYGLGIIEEELFETSEAFEVSPIVDNDWMNILEEQCSKKISWLGYSREEKRLFFLTSCEAEGLGSFSSNSKKAA